MTSAIGPGDYVECISADATPLLLGRLYVVRAAHPPSAPCFACGDFATPAVEVEGVEMAPGIGFCATCEVRPVYRRRQQLIPSLKAPAPPAVRELLDA